jgi:transposase
MPKTDRRTMSGKQAAKALGVSQSTVIAMLRRPGGLEGTFSTVRQRWSIKVSSVRALWESRQEHPSSGRAIPWTQEEWQQFLSGGKC